MKNSFKISQKFPVSPFEVYEAWLNSEKHSSMTGGQAHCSDRIGESFSAWDGYISGRNEFLIENKEIIQSWRTTEFAESDEDSKLVIRLEEIAEGCLLSLEHSNIPDGQPDYELGWINHYFNPMKRYFDQ